MLRVDHTKLTVSLLRGGNKLQKHMYNIMPAAHIYVYVYIYVFVYEQNLPKTVQQYILRWLECSPPALSNMVAPSHTWPLSTWKTASMTEELDVQLYLIIINLNLNSHKWQMATLLDGMGLEE